MQRRDSGDTLIEVLFAMAVFSFIVVTSLSLMNQGVAAAQRSLEITTVRQQMDGQAETLRFLHSSYVEAYQNGQTYNLTDGVSTPAEEYYRMIEHVKDTRRTSASPFGGTAACTVPSSVSTDFILNPVSGKFITDSMQPQVFQKATTFSQVTYTGGNQINKSEGIWLEGIRSAGTGPEAGYTDFHIRACWSVVGSDFPMNLGTIVRLYEPRG